MTRLALGDGGRDLKPWEICHVSEAISSPLFAKSTSKTLSGVVHHTNFRRGVRNWETH